MFPGSSGTSSRPRGRKEESAEGKLPGDRERSPRGMAAESPAASSPAPRPAPAILDILILIAVSGAAYLAESWAREAGIIKLGEDSRGLVAVLAGAATALGLVAARGGTLGDLGSSGPAAGGPCRCGPWARWPPTWRCRLWRRSWCLGSSSCRRVLAMMSYLGLAAVAFWLDRLRPPRDEPAA